MKPILLALGVACTAATAATLTVTSTADDGPPASPNTLRWAIEQANKSPEPVTIVFDLADGAVIALNSALPDVTVDGLTIDHASASSMTSVRVIIEPHYGGSRIVRFQGDNQAIRRVKFGGLGVTLEGSGKTLEHVDFANVFGDAVFFQGGEGRVVRNCSFSNVSGNAVHVEGQGSLEAHNLSALNLGGNLVSHPQGPSPPSLLNKNCTADSTTALFGISGEPGTTVPVETYFIFSTEEGTWIVPSLGSPSSVSINNAGVGVRSQVVPTGRDSIGAFCRTIYSQESETAFHCTEANNSTVATTPHAQPGGDPVSMYSGELFDLLPADFNLGGPMPLFFQRYYASKLKSDGKNISRLGHNWLHNFEWKLTSSIGPPPTVEVVDWQGRVIQFVKESDQWVLTGPRRDVPFQLVETESEFVFGDPRTHRLYLFDLTGRLTAIEDRRGNTHTLTYEGNDLASVSDGLGRVLTFDYLNDHLQAVHEIPRAVGFSQSAGELTQAFDSAGRTTTYIYGGPGEGLLTKTVRPENNTPFEQTFNAQGRVTSQTEAGGHVTTFVYGNSITDEFDPEGNRRTYNHNGAGNMTSYLDEARGLEVRVANNTNQQRINISDRRVTPFLNINLDYHEPSGRPAAITNADNTVLSFTYTNHTIRGITFHEVAGITYPDGATESFSYDAVGNLTGRVDPAGGQWTFGYNERGQVLAITNPVGGVVAFTYNPDGTPASRADDDTGVTLIEYDAQRRVSKVMHPDGAEELFTYDVNDRLLSVTDGRGNLTRFQYDRNGNLLRAIDANNRTNRFEYDGRDRVVRAVDRLGNTAARAFNSRGLLSTVTNRNGNVTTFTHDNRRRLTAITEPGAATSWRIGYANDGVANSFTNPLNQVTRMTLNARRYEIGRTNPLGHVTTLGRDAMMRITNVTDAIGRSRQFSYDGAGRLASATQPGGPAATYARNSLGLLTSITDLKVSQWDFGYTSMGRLASTTDPLNRTTQYAHDARGRTERIDFADGVSVTNAFDAAGNLTQRRYSDGTLLQYHYDALNRLVSANHLGRQLDALGRVINTTNTASAPVEFGAAYDADGRLTNVTYNAGLFSVTYTYDDRDRLTGVSDSLTGTQLTLVYDNANRLTELQRPQAPAGGQVVRTQYTYDAAGRRTRIRDLRPFAGTLVSDLQYTLDPAGQVSHLDYTLPLDPAALLASTTTSWTYDQAHQINNPGYSYDARGRLVSAPERTYQYDDASRLTAINDVVLAYNGFNDLLTRTENGTTTRFFYNHALGMRPIVAEKNETTDQFLRYYVWTPDGRLLYMIDAANGNAVRHFHFDRVGSTIALTAANGAVTDTYAYTPFGELLGRTGTSEQPFLYIGRYGVRSELGAALSHMRARYYDPASGRFLTRDPIWPVLSMPESLDPYQYAANNPLLFIDPLGLQSEEFEEGADLFMFGLFQLGGTDLNFEVPAGSDIFTLVPGYGRMFKHFLRVAELMMPIDEDTESPFAATERQPAPVGRPSTTEEEPPSAESRTLSLSIKVRTWPDSFLHLPFEPLDQASATDSPQVKPLLEGAVAPTIEIICPADRAKRQAMEIIKKLQHSGLFR